MQASENEVNYMKQSIYGEICSYNRNDKSV